MDKKRTVVALGGVVRQRLRGVESTPIDEGLEPLQGFGEQHCGPFHGVSGGENDGGVSGDDDSVLLRDVFDLRDEREAWESTVEKYAA